MDVLLGNLSAPVLVNCLESVLGRYLYLLTWNNTANDCMCPSTGNLKMLTI